MYLLWVLSFFKPVPPKTQNSLDKLACFTHANVLLSSVNQSTYLLGNLLFFKIHVSHFAAWDESPCAKVISERMSRVSGLVTVSEF